MEVVGFCGRGAIWRGAEISEGGSQVSQFEVRGGEPDCLSVNKNIKSPGWLAPTRNKIEPLPVYVFNSVPEVGSEFKKVAQNYFKKYSKKCSKKYLTGKELKKVVLKELKKVLKGQFCSKKYF